jgi:mono/diheme cytochrome c family protein
VRDTKLLLSGLAIGLLAWAIVLGMRLTPAANRSLLAAPTATNATRADTPTAEQLYTSSCANCHGASGEGRHPVFPPLAGSPYVTGDPARLAAIALHGMSGPIEVNGVAYAGLMPAFDHLDDRELALVLTHVRSAWGNDAGALTEADIAAIRATPPAEAQ